ncbi:MAG: hypothetical protein ACLQOO_01990 [Terriglobia bacterium]
MKTLASWSLAGVVLISGAGAPHGRPTHNGQKGGDQSSLASESAPTGPPCPAQAYDQEAPERPLSTSDMPADVRAGYLLFRAKCGLCHSLNQRPNKSESSAQDWTHMVHRMQDMPSSHITEKQADTIAKFVIWEADYSGEMVKTLMAFDRNGDGKLSRDELPQRLQGLFDRGDTNHDGFLTPAEIRKLAGAQGSSAPVVTALATACDPEARWKR